MESLNKYGFCPIVDEKDCTGCSACVNACSQHAISMVENSVGHLLPYILQESCIDCNACRKICPSVHPVKKTRPTQTYAAWAKDEMEHITSTSGGIAAVLSRMIIREGGIAYGCASLPEGKIQHIRVTDERDITLLKGSKYVQSEINDIYQQVKVDLISGRKVVFFGTPCQTAALKSFLIHEYQNLLVVDLICHSVPSQKLLFDHLSSKGIDRKNIEKIEFREGEQYCLKVTVGGKTVYQEDDFHDLYLSGFNDCLFSRESCVHCKYATNERVGDITIGDFRRLGKKTPFKEPNTGSISVVLGNTPKGIQMMAECKDLFNLYKRDFQEANDGNPHLHISPARKGNYGQFVSLYQRYGFTKAAKRTMWVRMMKNKILIVLDNMHLV